MRSALVLLAIVLYLAPLAAALRYRHLWRSTPSEVAKRATLDQLDRDQLADQLDYQTRQGHRDAARRIQAELDRRDQQEL